MRYTLIIFLLAGQVVAQTPGKKLFSSLPSSYTGVQFNNFIHEDDNYSFYNYEYIYNGGGVAIGDINNDGLQDIYFSSSTGFNKLYLNQGNLQFKDITESAGVDGGKGVKSGVNMIDINNDGWLDIIVSRSGPFAPQFRRKIVYINNGDMTFTDKAQEMGLDDASFTTQCYFLDYDKDGDMDVLMVNHPNYFSNTMVLNGKMVNGKLVIIDDTSRVNVSHRLYENRNGKFIDVSKKAGIGTYAFGLSAVITDFNNDGWPDIYIAHDFRKPDYLYINNKNGTFSEKLTDYFHHVSLSSMGTDMNDLNNDGKEDLFAVDMAPEDPVRQKRLFVLNQNYDRFQLMLQFGMYYQYAHNVLQLNMGNGSYSDIAYYAGVAETDWSWAPLIADYDNDGWKDIYVTTGYKRDITDWDYKEFVIDSIKNLIAKGQKVSVAEWFSKVPQTPVPNYFYHNNGSLKLDNYTSQWTDEPVSFSNGAAYADLDNDGDLDLVVNNIDGEAFVLRNNLNELYPDQHYIRFRFFKDKTSDREAYGTTVTLYDENGAIQFQRYDPQRGYMSSNEHFLHFGTGKKNTIAKAEIIFPSGKMIALQDLATNQEITLYESDATSNIKLETSNIKPFTETTSKANFNYKHIENDFIDFKREPLIPYRCSRKGPFYAKADVNGDNMEDIYIGGTAGNEGTLMMQTANGFIKKAQPAFAKDMSMEDGGAVFFDADADGDNDLYVVSAGAEFAAGSAQYQDRLYINDGKGNFTRSLNAIPAETQNGSYVIALDFDDDGDQDLFIGGAVMPGKFPKHDRNMLLQNNKGVFTDVTEYIAPTLNNSGIVNYAAWGDLDGDGKKELVIAGEWMPIEIFKMQQGKFVRDDASISNISGLWNTIVLDDIDNDGDLDIIAGNRGTNSRVTASLDNPCKIYAKDFDNNGSYDAVLGYYNQGRLYPMYSRDQLIDEMPFFRKKYYRYHLYAGRTLDELFTDEQKKGMDTYSVSCFESGIFFNDGKGNFKFSAFPAMAQFSSISDILVTDINTDGKKDLIVSGNSYDADVSTGNYDAMPVLLMKGDGKGNFEADMQSGLISKGEVRKMIPLNKGKTLVLLRNNDEAQVFSKN